MKNMGRIQFDLLNLLSRKKSVDEATMIDILGISEEKFKKVVNDLIKKAYLNKDLTLTQKSKDEYLSKKPRNAIILADNLGLGMLTKSKDVPVGLLEMNGSVIIERLIEQLHEADINEIDILIGFGKEKYDYLKKKYQVNLIYQTEHAYLSSLHSLKLVKEKLANSYILPGNIWAEKNPFSRNELYSWYGILDTVDDYSIVRLKQQDNLLKVEEGRAGNTMTGMAYLLKEEVEIFLEKMGVINSRKQDDRIWENFLFDEDEEMIVHPKVFNSNQIYLINDYQQLKQLEEDSTPLDSEIMNVISKELHVVKEDIRDIFILEEGKTNSSFRFTVRNKEYIMRIPGKGTDELVNRENEYAVYELLKGREISDKVIYLSSENGYKISKFIRGARTCDPYNKEDVLKAMANLRKFHEYELELSHNFDLFNEIEKYEKLRGSVPSKYKDYKKTKENVFSLKKTINQFKKKKVLCHCDSVPGNFLMAEDKVYLIDWEYAGMQDPHLDIAMFALSAMYTREELDELIGYYFWEGYNNQIKYKIYSYMAIAGLIWSNWSEYKESLGVYYGNYSLMQYEYSKKYYEIVKKEYLPMLNN